MHKIMTLQDEEIIMLKKSKNYIPFLYSFKMMFSY